MTQPGARGDPRGARHSNDWVPGRARKAVRARPGPGLLQAARAAPLQVRVHLIELLICRCSTPCSVMHTAATVVVPYTANGVTHDKRWAMEDARAILRGPVLYGSARSKKKRQESSSQRQILHRPGAVNHRT